MCVLQLGRTCPDIRLERVDTRRAVVDGTLGLGDASLSFGDEALAPDDGFPLRPDVVSLVAVAAVKLRHPLLCGGRELLRRVRTVVLGQLVGP